MDNQYAKLTQKIPYDKNIHKSIENYNNVINNLLEDSKNIGLSLKYPYEDWSDKDLPTKYNNWQIRCCLQLYKLAGTSNISKYSENGLSWETFRNGLSLDLIHEIVSNAGIPKAKVEEE